MSSTIIKELGDTVKKTISSKDVQSKYKDNIDKYLSMNTDKYFIVGPGARPIWSTELSEQYIRLIGLDPAQVKSTIKNCKAIGANWNIMNNPFNTANAVATRQFSLNKNEEFVKYSKWYLLVALYPSLHYKYFEYGTNEACMNYTIANLSGKFSMKRATSMWQTFTDMIDTAFELHRDRLASGEDKAIVAYIQDVHSRMNNLLKNIANEYYDNYKNQRYLKIESESYDDDNYYEAESSSYLIDKLTNKVVTHLVVNGPDMKLVQLAAKTNNVSVNQLRTYVTTMVTEKQRDDIHAIVESILYLFLNAEDEHHTPQEIGTNVFMIYCLQIYKKSNTSDKNIIRIKDILDRWLDELGLKEKSSRTATLISFRRALYTFFVMSIQKIAG